MLSVLLLTAVFSINDSLGDVGINDLEPPNSVVFRNLDTFDLLGLSIPDEPTFGFELEFKQLNNPWSLEFGFSLPIIEIYAEVPNQPTGTAILPGSGMSLPNGERWSYAFKLTGDGLNVYAPRQGKIVDITNVVKAVLSKKNNTLIINTNLPLKKNITLYGVVGSYDPFTLDGWRALSEETSAWAFSSKTYKLPILDVLADSDSLQRQALQVGILPGLEVKPSVKPWTYLTILGAILVVIGLITRFWLTRANPKGDLVNARAKIKITRRERSSSGRGRAVQEIMPSGRSRSVTRATPKRAPPNYNFEPAQPNQPSSDFKSVSINPLEQIDSDIIFTLGEIYSESIEGKNKNVTWNSKEDNSRLRNIDNFKNVQKDAKDKEVVLKSDSKDPKKQDLNRE